MRIATSSKTDDKRISRHGDYFGEKFLREQLDSIASQTIKPLELVVCDDGSTDRTKSILAEFAATAPFPVRVHHNETRPRVYRQLSRRHRAVQGHYVALCDQDDLWFETKLETAFARLEETGACLHSHSATVIGDDGARRANCGR